MNVGRPYSETTHKIQQTQAGAAFSDITNKNIRENLWPGPLTKGREGGTPRKGYTKIKRAFTT